MGTIDALDDRKAHQVVYQIHFNLPASSAIHLIITDFRKKKYGFTCSDVYSEGYH